MVFPLLPASLLAFLNYINWSFNCRLDILWQYAISLHCCSKSTIPAFVIMTSYPSRGCPAPGGSAWFFGSGPQHPPSGFSSYSIVGTLSNVWALPPSANSASQASYSAETPSGLPAEN